MNLSSKYTTSVKNIYSQIIFIAYSYQNFRNFSNFIFIYIYIREEKSYLCLSWILIANFQLLRDNSHIALLNKNDRYKKPGMKPSSNSQNRNRNAGVEMSALIPRRKPAGNKA